MRCVLSLRAPWTGARPDPLTRDSWDPWGSGVLHQATSRRAPIAREFFTPFCPVDCSTRLSWRRPWQAALLAQHRIFTQQRAETRARGVRRFVIFYT